MAPRKNARRKTTKQPEVITLFDDVPEVCKRTTSDERRIKREDGIAQFHFYQEAIGFVPPPIEIAPPHIKTEPMDPGYDDAEAGPAPAPDPDGYGTPQPMEEDPVEPGALNQHALRIKQEPLEDPAPQDYMEQDPMNLHNPAAIRIKQEPMDVDEQPADAPNDARDGSEGFYFEREQKNGLIAPALLGALQIAVADPTSNGRHVQIKTEPLDSPNSDHQAPEAMVAPRNHVNIKAEVKPEPVDHFEGQIEHEEEYDIPGTSDGLAHGSPQHRPLRGTEGVSQRGPTKIQVPLDGTHIKLEVRDKHETERLPPKQREVQEKINAIANTKVDKTLVPVEAPMNADEEVVVTKMTQGHVNKSRGMKDLANLLSGMTDEEKSLMSGPRRYPSRRNVQRINYREEALAKTVNPRTYIPRQPGNGILKVPKPEPSTPRRGAGRPRNPNPNPKPPRVQKGRGRPRKDQKIKEEPEEAEEPAPVAEQEDMLEATQPPPQPRREVRESSEDLIIIDPHSSEIQALVQQDQLEQMEQEPEQKYNPPQPFEVPMEVQAPQPEPVVVIKQEERPRPIMQTKKGISMDDEPPIQSDSDSGHEDGDDADGEADVEDADVFEEAYADVDASSRAEDLGAIMDQYVESPRPVFNAKRAPKLNWNQNNDPVRPGSLRLADSVSVEGSGPVHVYERRTSPAESWMCSGALHVAGPASDDGSELQHTPEPEPEPEVEASEPVHNVKSASEVLAEYLQRHQESEDATSTPLQASESQSDEPSEPLHHSQSVSKIMANLQSGAESSGPMHLTQEDIDYKAYCKIFIKLFLEAGRNKSNQMSTASTSKRLGRNTNNSRSSIPTPLHPQVTRRSRVVDSDDDDDDDSSDAEMASTSDTAELAKRPRTPKPRYSPETPRRNTPRAAMSALSIETHRNTDLNADGTGPSSSGSQQPPLSGDSERREMRRRDDSIRRKQQVHHHHEDPKDTPRSHHRKQGHLHMSCRSHKKKVIGGSPEPHLSQDETFMDMDQESDDACENLPIIVDEPNFKLTTEQKAQFRAIKRHVKQKITIPPHQLAEIYKTARSEDVRLPRHIYFGAFIMQAWFGAPFPLEYINTEILFVCEFCLFYARSEPVLQNHTKKCWVRTPPGDEIYRKDNISIFEVDGRVERDYCQNVCLISRLFLESKTLFYDTDPFLFYIVTINDEIGAHFAGYFSKEKYEPDKNNLSCIMTLPCFQDKGLGRFLIDVSYALSRKEGWFGGPEQPLSDLGRIAYGSYWRGAIYDYLHEHKMDIEEGDGVSVDCIAIKTGINHHDILEFLDSMGWIGFEDDPDEEGVCLINWNVDWGIIKAHVEEKKRSKKIQFDEKFLDWQPRKITPKMDAFVELTPQEVEEDEEKLKKKLQQTPISSASLLKSTPASSTSQQNGSIKKTLRSRGSSRSVGRNLKLEISKKVTVPEWAGARDVSDDEAEKKKRDKKKQKKERRKMRNAASACHDIEKSTKREESPEDDAGPSTSAFKAPEATGRRRTRQAADDSSDSKGNPSNSGGGQGKRSKRAGKNMYEGDGSDSSSSSESSDDDDVPFGAQKGKKGSGKGKKRQRNHKPVSGKSFPPNYGQRKKEEIVEKMDDSEVIAQKIVENQNPERIDVEENKQLVREDVVMREEREKSDEELDADLIMVMNNDVEEELGRDYIIGTPESYHSTPPASPAPLLAEENLPPPQLFGSHPAPQAQHQHHLSVEHQQHFEENDAAPPLLVAHDLTVSEPIDRGNLAANPILAPNLADGDGYSTGEDEAPPRLSPQYGKSEAHETEEVKEADPQLMAPAHNGMNAYDPMAPGPSMHMTPQMMTPQNRHPSTSTPQQHPYSHQGPNSHQNTTPGSGGVPSCGPVYNHSTPEQQAAQQQQFMSPMAGMPGSVQSVHSVHNNNSMEMVGGPASLQHTPQYDMAAHSMGQMPQDNGVMGNGVATIEQQNQIMMAQHGFNSPPGQNNVLQQQPPQVQPPAPPQVAQMPAAPAPTNGRRRQSDTAAARKRNQQRGHQMAPAQMMMPQQMVPAAMNYYNPMNFMQGYNPYQWEYYNYGLPVYPQLPDYGRPWAVQYPPVQPQVPPAPQPQNGHVPADNGARGVPAQFPPQTAANQWFNANQWPNHMH